MFLCMKVSAFQNNHVGIDTFYWISFPAIFRGANDFSGVRFRRSGVQIQKPLKHKNPTGATETAAEGFFVSYYL